MILSTALNDYIILQQIKSAAIQDSYQEPGKDLIRMRILLDRNH